jgi:hypothetical protein
VRIGGQPVALRIEPIVALQAAVQRFTELDRGACPFTAGGRGIARQRGQPAVPVQFDLHHGPAGQHRPAKVQRRRVGGGRRRQQRLDLGQQRQDPQVLAAHAGQGGRGGCGG